MNAFVFTASSSDSYSPSWSGHSPTWQPPWWCCPSPSESNCPPPSNHHPTSLQQPLPTLLSPLASVGPRGLEILKERFFWDTLYSFASATCMHDMHNMQMSNIFGTYLMYCTVLWCSASCKLQRTVVKWVSSGDCAASAKIATTINWGGPETIGMGPKLWWWWWWAGYGTVRNWFWFSALK